MKAFVLTRYPDAYAAKDIDGYWWVWTPKLRGALNFAQQPTKSAATAWWDAGNRIKQEQP